MCIAVVKCKYESESVAFLCVIQTPIPNEVFIYVLKLLMSHADTSVLPVVYIYVIE